jgi:NAD(P)H-dependent flavin oxidoreductase YrpB (nitropropane dioxygenase family)
MDDDGTRLEEFVESAAPIEDILQFMKDHSMYDALIQGDIDLGELPCGQIAGIITELESAGDVVRNIVAELPTVIEVLRSKNTS